VIITVTKYKLAYIKYIKPKVFRLFDQQIKLKICENPGIP